MTDEPKVYGLEDWVSLEMDLDAVVERVVDEACEVVGEGFVAIVARMKWPLRVVVYRRAKIVPDGYVDGAVIEMLDALNEKYTCPDSEPTEATETMRAAAKTFIAAVLAEYVPWTCEPTGEVIEVTELQAREMLGEKE